MCVFVDWDRDRERDRERDMICVTQVSVCEYVYGDRVMFAIGREFLLRC